MIFVWAAVVVLALFGLTVFFGAPYVPSLQTDLHDALAHVYTPTRGDVVIDIGSGDGTVLRAVSQYGARAIGYEINPVLVLVTMLLSRKNKNVSVRWANIWRVTFPADTTVVYVFSESRDIQRIANKVQAEARRLKRPLKLLSYGFSIPGKTAIKSSKSHHLYEFR
ncbi:hypothetical protein KBD87_00120 [Candidatus Saccharibacteria bacterium]|jgi:SAM-dependent methyltransferase|nr:hypothetical protein [Candidatus Saccharibacteria bacterium]